MDRRIALALAAEELLRQERRLHAETRRKLEKADHDRRRYKQRIATLNLRLEVISKEYCAEKDVNRSLRATIALLVQKN